MLEKKGLWIYIEVLKLFKQEESPKLVSSISNYFQIPFCKETEKIL